MPSDSTKYICDTIYRLFQEKGRQNYLDRAKTALFVKQCHDDGYEIVAVDTQFIGNGWIDKHHLVSFVISKPDGRLLRCKTNIAYMQPLSIIESWIGPIGKSVTKPVIIVDPLEDDLIP